MVVVQIEALCRYKDTADLVIVDEWESVLSQMKSQYALQQVNIVENLRRLV
jgi:hypothetical protein